MITLGRSFLKVDIVKSLIDQVATPAALVNGLYKARPGVTSYKYKKQWDLLRENDYWAREVSAQLLGGEFRFSDPEYLEINGKRPILLIGAQDRAVEQALLAVTQGYLDSVLAFPNSYARRAVGEEDKKSLQELAKDVCRARQQKPFVFETDIKKFFPSVQNKVLIKALDRYLPDSSLNFLFKQIVERRPPDMTRVSKSLEYLFEEIDRGVPQGSCMSPILASLYLEPLDRFLTDRGIKYIRYVDDLVVFTKSAAEAEEIEQSIHKVLGRLKLCAHKSSVKEDEKGHIRTESQRLSFVGFDFIPPNLVQPQQKAIDRFKDRMLAISMEARTLHQLLTEISNFTKGWRAAYSCCSVPNGLKAKLDAQQMQAIKDWTKQNNLVVRPKSSNSVHTLARALGVELFQEKKGALEDRLDTDNFLDNLELAYVVGKDDNSK